MYVKGETSKLHDSHPEHDILGVCIVKYTQSKKKHLLPPDVVLPVVHRHEPPARVKVKEHFFEIRVVLRTDIDAPRLTMRWDRYPHHQRLVQLHVLGPLAISQPKVGETADERVHRRVHALSVFLSLLESTEIALQQQARRGVLLFCINAKQRAREGRTIVSFSLIFMPSCYCCKYQYVYFQASVVFVVGI